jgi:hypothetical protein
VIKSIATYEFCIAIGSCCANLGCLLLQDAAASGNWSRFFEMRIIEM